jgi:hypothetical protein
LLNNYSLLSDLAGTLEKSSETFGPSGVCNPKEPTCKAVLENEQGNSSLAMTQRQSHLMTSEPQHITLIVFEIDVMRHTHLEADTDELTMESDLKKILSCFTLTEKNDSHSL